MVVAASRCVWSGVGKRCGQEVRAKGVRMVVSVLWEIVGKLVVRFGPKLRSVDDPAAHPFHHPNGSLLPDCRLMG